VERAPALAVAFTLASLPFLLPHVIEDFHLGIAGRVGLPADVGASFLGFGLAAQLLGLILTAQGRRAGLAILAVASTVWTVGSVWEHGLPVLVEGLDFRGRALSALWAAGLLVTQALAAACAWAGLARWPR
jgi:hypothetical protein